MNMHHAPFADLAPQNDMSANARFRPSNGAPQKEPMKPFVFVAVGDLKYHPPEFLVEGLIEAETLGLIFGDPGCGKSFLAVDLALSVASGLNFHGRAVKAGSVFYIAGEGHNGLVRRFNAWSKHHRRPLKNVPLFKSERAAQFLDSGSALSVAQAVRALAADHGAPSLIVVDTLARNFGPGDENSTAEMGKFVAAMDDLRANWPDCTVLIVHHSGHAEKQRARGAIALKGALDFEFRLEKDGVAMSLINTKMKDADPPADMHFNLTSLEICDGVSSAVLTEGEASPKKCKITGQAKVALQAFDDALALHGEAKHGDMFPQNRQCVSLECWREYCDRHSLSSGTSPTSPRTAFHKAWHKLRDAGIICVVDGFAWRVEARS